jgi:hypothetical protein
MPKIILNSLNNATTQQVEFAETAVSILQQIVNHQLFQEDVSSWNYQFRKYWDDSGNIIEADNQKVWEIVSSGKERNQLANQEINLKCEFKKLDDSGKVMGRVIPPHPLITTNTIWLDWVMENNNPLSLAAHWMHEWMHVAGFYHPKKDSLRREDVTYSVGKIALAVGRSILGKGQKSASVLNLGKEYEESIEADFCDVIENE